ncbi:MAG TPA: IS1 family transposase [Saprospiraceae bacterium]|nr:IS1 family transposase [Saprospiraceae bacterium]
MLNSRLCPHCLAERIQNYSSYETKSDGTRTLYQCSECHQVFSETKGTFLEGLKKPISLIIKVLKSRSEGMGFNAACRVFEISKNTLLEWEQRVADWHSPLLMYALLHNFVTQLIEGDEVYTKVGKNVPPADAEGWTVVLMDRASRFIWALTCGKKGRALFLSAIQILSDIISRTGDITLLTDGERRYSLLLFEICQELFRSGRRGRPRRVLRRGVRVRLKNKGSQLHRRGRKRPKYEAPCSEHPETPQNLSDAEIHANHAEALNASLRRRNSAYRRKTNSYAKKKPGLQRTLDIFWIVHNFIRKHFTTQRVPAVALGILKEGLSWEQILRIQRQPIVSAC